jgi:hypothetical protein
MMRIREGEVLGVIITLYALSTLLGKSWKRYSSRIQWIHRKTALTLNKNTQLPELIQAGPPETSGRV